MNTNQNTDSLRTRQVPAELNRVIAHKPENGQNDLLDRSSVNGLIREITCSGVFTFQYDVQGSTDNKIKRLHDEM